MKLWVDDKRSAPEGWVRARTFGEAQAILADVTDSEYPGEVSLDYDLSDYAADGAAFSASEAGFTGMDLLKMLVDRKEAGLVVPRVVHVHSTSSARKSMNDLVDKYFKEIK